MASELVSGFDSDALEPPHLCPVQTCRALARLAHPGLWMRLAAGAPACPVSRSATAMARAAPKLGRGVRSRTGHRRSGGRRRGRDRPMWSWWWAGPSEVVVVVGGTVSRWSWWWGASVDGRSRWSSVVGVVVVGRPPVPVAGAGSERAQAPRRSPEAGTATTTSTPGNVLNDQTSRGGPLWRQVNEPGRWW